MTYPPALPAELRAFLYSCIDSVEQVEILLLLRRDVRARTAREVSGETGLGETAARRDLETLVARGLLAAEKPGAVLYRYQPKSPDLRRYADQLAQFYAENRTAVAGFIATQSRRSIKTFSDAFKLRDQE